MLEKKDKNFIQAHLNEPKHHAYLIFSNGEFDIKDMEYINTPTIDMEFARKLIDTAILGSSGLRKIVIKAQNITPSAQNALLKLFEESRENLSLFLLLPSDALILDTLLSRCYIIRDKENDVVEIGAYIKMSLKDKMEFLNTLWEKDSKTELANFLDSYAEYLHKKFIKKADIQTAQTLKQIIDIKAERHTPYLNKTLLYPLIFN